MVYSGSLMKSSFDIKNVIIYYLFRLKTRYKTIRNTYMSNYKAKLTVLVISILSTEGMAEKKTSFCSLLF